MHLFICCPHIIHCCLAETGWKQEFKHIQSILGSSRARLNTFTRLETAEVALEAANYPQGRGRKVTDLPFPHLQGYNVPALPHQNELQ